MRTPLKRLRPAITVLLVGIWVAGPIAAAAHAERRIALTFDDLPAPPSGIVSNDVAAVRENTRKLLVALKECGAPAVGFVNEGRLWVNGETPKDVASRTAVLRMWLEAGLELGNHTYSHWSLNTTPLEEFEADVVRGEPVTRRLLAEKGLKLRYFRHPFLQVGLSLDKRQAFEAFLRERGYTIAPVTIDNDDYIYAAVYADALRRGETALAARIGTDYLRYMEEVFSFAEEVSRKLTGREIAQILLLHANSLNGDCFGRLAAALKGRGYRFVTLDEALGDEAYALKDTYVASWGTSWLHHWELGAGRSRTPPPNPAAWITKAYETIKR